MIRWKSASNVFMGSTGRRSYFYVSFLSFLFYVCTLAPTVVGGDSAKYARFVHNMYLFFGRADAHPLHTLLGKLFSFLPLELAYSLNLMSAFFAGLTVGLVYLIIKNITSSGAAALSGALLLMVSHTFWFHAVITEVYSLHAFFLALLIHISIHLTKIKRSFILFITVLVLGLLNHLVLILTVPGFMYFFLSRLDPKTKKIMYRLALTVAGIVMGILILGLLFVPDGTILFLRTMLMGEPPIIGYLLPPMDLKIFLKEIVFYIAYLFYQFPFVGFVLGILGIFGMMRKKRKIAVFLLLLMLVNGLFYIKNTYWPSYGGTKFSFYLTDYVVFSLFIGYGYYFLLEMIRQRKSTPIRIFANSDWNTKIPVLIIALLTVILYSVVPLTVSFFKIDLVHARTLPYRDNNRYFLNPDKSGYTGDRKQAEEILSMVNDSSLVFADFTIYSTLTYLQEVDRIRADVLVRRSEGKPILAVLKTLDRTSMGKNIYIADMDESSEYYNFQGLQNTYRFVQIGKMWELIPIR